jgi:hypothetical protein
MNRAIPNPADLIGSYKRFGDFGPVYVVEAVGAQLPGGDVSLRLRLLETEELVDLPYSMVLRHPEAD